MTFPARKHKSHFAVNFYVLLINFHQFAYLSCKANVYLSKVCNFVDKS